MQTSGEAVGYRPVSRLAVASAVVGVLSSVALTTPLLWIVPLVGIALAVAGLADVSRVGAEKAGRAAALVGLALSAGFGTQAVTTSLVARWITQGRTKAVVHAWLDAIGENRIADARSMIAPHLLPQSWPGKHGENHQGLGGPPHGEPGHSHQHGGDVGTEEPMSSLPAVQAILQCGATAARNVRSAGRAEEGGERWCVRVRLGPCGDGRSVDLLLELEPAIVNEPKRRVERWAITKIDLGP